MYLICSIEVINKFYPKIEIFFVFFLTMKNRC